MEDTDKKEAPKKASKKQTKSDKEFVKNTVEFNPDLEEQKKGTVVIGWGRMNPITVGHEKLVDKLRSVARSEGAVPLLFLSHSQDKKKNPLSYGDKVTLARRAFGSIVKTSKSKTIIDVLKELQNKYSEVVLVVGSDRVKQFNDLIQKYNGKDYTFDSLKVVSAGERDPDADDVSGMSASKMRALASAGKKDEFKKGLPRKLQGSSDEVYDMVRAGMQLAEELEAEGLLVEAPLTIMQRLKRSRIMKRYASKIRAARKRKSRRKATLDVLKKRARKKAIDIIRKKVAGARGKSYADMTVGEKIAIDKKVQKRQAAIERIAKKLVPKVRKIEQARLQGRRVNEEFEMMLEDYYKGVPRKQRDARKAHFERGAKMDDDNPAAYAPAPGDKGAKTKESKHTKKFRQMFGEQPNIVNDDKPKKKSFHQMMNSNGSPKLDKRFKINRKDYQSDQTEAVDPRVARLKDQHRAEKNRLRRSHEIEMDRVKTSVIRGKTSRRNTPISEDAELLKLVKEIHESLQLDESKVKTALQKKADKTGISYGILKKVYDRGVAAWRTGHRPGTTPSQWGMARVNSFATKSKGTWGKADKDLAAKVRKEEVSLDEAFESLIEAKADKPLRWKRAGNDGEIEATVNGQRWKIEKSYDDNLRHKGEFKVLAWNKRTDDWEWDNTVRGKNQAKAWATRNLKEDISEEIKPHSDVVKAYKKLRDAEDQAADYNHRSNKARVTRGETHLRKMIDKHHPGLGMQDRVKLHTALQNMKEEHGAGFRGTSDLADRYAKDTPGQEPMKTHKNKYKEPKAKNYNEEFESLFKGTEE